MTDQNFLIQLQGGSFDNFLMIKIIAFGPLGWEFCPIFSKNSLRVRLWSRVGVAFVNFTPCPSSLRLLGC